MTDIYACVLMVFVGCSAIAFVVRLRQHGEAIEALREAVANHKHTISVLGESHKQALDGLAAAVDVHSEALDEMGRVRINPIEVNTDDPDRFANELNDRLHALTAGSDPDPIYFTTEPRFRTVEVVDAPDGLAYAGIMETGGRPPIARRIGETDAALRERWLEVRGGGA